MTIIQSLSYINSIFFYFFFERLPTKFMDDGKFFLVFIDGKIKTIFLVASFLPSHPHIILNCEFCVRLLHYFSIILLLFLLLLLLLQVYDGNIENVIIMIYRFIK